MQDTVNERLKILINELGTNPSALARMLGISASTLRNYTDRESKPGYEVLEKLYHSFKHINLPWLFGDAGQPLLAQVEEPATSYQTQNQNQKKNQGTINTYTNTGTATYTLLQDCERDNASLRTENELLRSQLLDKERLIRLYESQQPK